MANIQVFNNIHNLQSIKVKKPYKVNDIIYIFDISFQNQPLLLQSSPCIVPYSYYVFDNKSLQLDIQSCDVPFKNTLTTINKHIINKVSKFDNTILQHKCFLDYVKEVKHDQSNNTNDFKLRLRNVNVNNVSVFDIKNNLVNLTTIQTFDRIMCLFQIQKLIVQKDTYYFQVSVVQIKKLNIPLLTIKECVIDSTQENGEEDVYMECAKSTEIVTSCKPPSKPIMLNQLFDQIKQGVNLKKIEDNTSTIKAKQQSDKSKTSNCQFQPPSLSDILQARTNLKPVGAS